MPVYLVSGKLGAGKTLACVGRIQDALREGRRVATNLDLKLEKLFRPHAGKPVPSDGSSASHQPLTVMRVPDKPTSHDLDVIGMGNESMDESKNGLLVLDELGSWLNAREWADKSRQGVIDWLIHSRKKGWDVYLIVQDVSLVDKQVRSALVEYLVTCRRMDRMRIPFFGPLIKFMSGGYMSGNMPKMHFGIVRYGVSPDAVVADRWVYLGRALYDGYETRQVFSSTYDSGVYSYLPPWHVVGRHLKPKVTLLEKLHACFFPARMRSLAPSPRLAPLLHLPAEVRWNVARSLVARGIL